MKLAQKIIRIAKGEIGVLEIGDTNCGLRVDQYKAATYLPEHESWPWCAAFVDWVVWEAMNEDALYSVYTFKRPTTAGAWDLENWSRKQDASTDTLRNPGRDIRAGDIVIFTFSHVGFCVDQLTAAGNVPTVEGNTNHEGAREGGGVWPQFRKLSQIKTRIRFTV